MRHTATTALAVAGLLALAGCTSSGTKPAATAPPASTTSAAPAQDTAALIRACVDAIAAGKDDSSTGAAECNTLPRTDYLEALHEADAAAQKAFQDDTDRAASADATP